MEKGDLTVDVVLNVEDTVKAFDNCQYYHIYKSFAKNLSQPVENIGYQSRCVTRRKHGVSKNESVCQS